MKIFTYHIFGEHLIWQNGSLLVLVKFKLVIYTQIHQIKNLTNVSRYNMVYSILSWKTEESLNDSVYSVESSCNTIL